MLKRYEGETIVQPALNGAIHNVFLYGLEKGREMGQAVIDDSPVPYDGAVITQPALNEALQNVINYGVQQGRKGSPKKVIK